MRELVQEATVVKPTAVDALIIDAALDEVRGLPSEQIRALLETEK